jgi:hypothetical protein
MYHKLTPHLNTYEDKTGKWKQISACDYIFMAHYDENNNFSIHTDTGCYCDATKKSSNTLLIYLNDNFIGGETSFYDNDFNHVVTIKAKKGRAILFNILIWHTGEKIIEGEKSWIGTEIISNKL